VSDTVVEVNGFSSKTPHGAPNATNAPAIGRGPSEVASTTVPETEMADLGYDSGTPVVDSTAFDTMSTSIVRLGLMLSQVVPDGQGDIYAPDATGAMLTKPPRTDAEYRPSASLVA
jgi:hypothetical protein